MNTAGSTRRPHAGVSRAVALVLLVCVAAPGAATPLAAAAPEAECDAHEHAAASGHEARERHHAAAPPSSPAVGAAHDDRCPHCPVTACAADRECTSPTSSCGLPETATLVVPTTAGEAPGTDAAAIRSKLGPPLSPPPRPSR